MSAKLCELYFGAATQYYVAGRYAVFAGLTPIAGNLLHHAVEMAMKGHLARTVSPSDLKDHKHSLSTLWRTFKENLPTADLKRYDTVIARLDQLETIRYPEHIAKHGMLVMQDAAKVQSRKKAKLPQTIPHYDLRLQDVDALLDAIFASSSVNPKFFVAGLNSAAKKYLAENNATNLAD
jgi:hypothetical protein